MACIITITKVTGIMGINGLGPNTIVVEGTVGEEFADCSSTPDGTRVTVGLSCVSEDGPFAERAAKILPDETWEAEFLVDEACSCGGTVFVRAHCAQNEDCNDTLRVERLDCIACPRVQFEPFTAPVIHPCNPDGTRDVTLKAVLSDVSGIGLSLIHI